MIENRKRIRKRVSLEVDAVIGRKIVQSETFNISATGAFIKTRMQFVPGEDARLVFVVPNHNGAKPVKLKARIVRNEDQGVSVQFVGVSPYFVEILDAAIQKL